MPKRKIPEPVSVTEEKSRVFPLLIAGVFCFFVAALLGYGSWRLFGTVARQNGDTARFLESLGMAPNDVVSNTEIQATPKIVEKKPAPAPVEEPAETSLEIKGTVVINGGETAVGGGASQRPLRREFVRDFLIAETEVTNGDYRSFVEATGYRAPDHWINKNSPEEMEDFPVVFVSAKDAEEFCKWKSKDLGMEVRLPTIAEWQRAASGDKRFKYPWGNEWNEAAISSEKKPKAAPVKSFELNRSPFGAFDMVGNVWEWTAEILKKEELESKAAISGYRPSSQIRLVLGGSFSEDRRKLSNSFWAEIDSETRNKSVGFRYVIIPESK